MLPFGRRDRDPVIDALRGLAILAVIIDHIGGHSPLRLLTGGGQFYTSAAEALVFLSGLVAGFSSRQTAARVGLGAASRRLLRRAGELYLLTVALTLGVTIVGDVFGFPWQTIGTSESPLTLAGNALVLRQPALLSEIPRMYAVFIALSPIALACMVRGWTWVILLLSWGMWIVQQLLPTAGDLPWALGASTFPLQTWQVLFFTGMVLGYHRASVVRLLRSDGLRWVMAASAATCVAALGLYICTHLQQLTHGGLPGLQLLGSGSLEDSLFNKDRLRIGRVVVSAALFGCCWFASARIWANTQRWSGWLLLPLGQNALYAFSAHAVLAVTVGVAFGWYGDGLSGNRALNVIVQLSSVGLILLAIRTRFLFPHTRDGRLAFVALLESGVTWLRGAPQTIKRVATTA